MADDPKGFGVRGALFQEIDGGARDDQELVQPSGGGDSSP